MFDIDFDELDDKLKESEVNSSKTTEQKQNQTSNSNDTAKNKKELMKIAIVGLSIGLVLILGTIAIASNSGKKDNNNAVINNKPDKIGNNVENEDTQQKPVDKPMQQKPQTEDKTNSNWVAFNSGEVSFLDEKVDSVFKIKSIEHFVCTDETDEHPQLKSILTGTLEGYDGEYELELPYSKGSRLEKGIEFDVQVDVGLVGSKVVIGGIEY